MDVSFPPFVLCILLSPFTCVMIGFESCMWKDWITSSAAAPCSPQSAAAWVDQGLFGWPADLQPSVERGWTRLGFISQTTWISSSLGLSPRHSRHQWSFTKCILTGLFALSSLPAIGEMSSADVNITRVRESGFLRGARKLVKKNPSEPIMFCYSRPLFKCSSLPFWIRRRLARWIAGPTGCESGAGCALPCCSVATQTCQFVLSWLSKCHCVGHFLTHTI